MDILDPIISNNNADGDTYENSMMGQEDFAGQWPASLIFQLGTRSSTRSSRCIPAGLEEGARTCQSSMVPDRICSQQSTVTRSSCNPSGPIAKESSSVVLEMLVGYPQLISLQDGLL